MLDVLQAIETEQVVESVQNILNWIKFIGKSKSSDKENDSNRSKQVKIYLSNYFLRITFHMSTLDPTNQNCPISEERISEQLG